MEKVCKHCNKNFSISNDELEMYEKVGVYITDLCFHCRVRQHFAFWPFGKFRKTVSALSGDSIITTLSSTVKYPIYTLKEWYSDAWDAMDYGQTYDENHSFFDQLTNLQSKVPRAHQNGSNNLNCDWSDDVWNSKNCYLSRSLETCEDLLYSYRVYKVRNSIDLAFCFDSDNCYDSLYCFNSYNLFYSQNSRDCIDSYFLYDCRNCQNCFMSWNLRGKSFCIENVQYTKEEYFERIKSFNLGSFSSVLKLKEYFSNIVSNEVVHRENFNIKSAESVGEFLVNTKNCNNCFMINDSEDIYNMARGMKNKSSIDINGCWSTEMSGNCSCCVDGYALKYSLWSPSRFSEYLDTCIECENCFGCVGLRKKKYCILNKQYTKDEYENLKNIIISDMKDRGEYGNFLPYSMATTPYNFSTSMIYFPDTEREEIERLGGYFEDLNEDHIVGLPTSELPDSIYDVDDSITSTALICPVTGWRFNVSQNELQFYKQKGLPLPREHFDVRIKRQLEKLTVLDASEFNCIYCNKEINAYYPKSWNYKKVACVECYQKEIA